MRYYRAIIAYYDDDGLEAGLDVQIGRVVDGAMHVDQNLGRPMKPHELPAAVEDSARAMATAIKNLAPRSRRRDVC